MDNTDRLDLRPHDHGTGRHAYTHTHAWASVPHSHMLRAICNLADCVGQETHNIHSEAHHSFDDAVTELEAALDGVEDEALRRAALRAASEVVRLRALVRELRPYAARAAEELVAIGEAPEDHRCEPACPDCASYTEGLRLSGRVAAGAYVIDPLPRPEPGATPAHPFPGTSRAFRAPRP